MFHFLCEGKKGKSEYIFIEAIIELYHTDEEYCLEAAGGNKNIESVFLSMKRKFKAGDTFILFFDCVETINGVSIYDILLSFKETCEAIGVYFRYTNYYCFEELFLSYTKIINMLNNIDSVLVNEIINIQDYINNGINYFRTDISFWEDYFKDEKGLLRTRESLSAGICNLIFNKVDGSFILRKNKIGDCWITNCKDTKLHENICNLCCYPMKNNCFKEKLIDLENNSVARLGLSFSTIFN